MPPRRPIFVIVTAMLMLAALAFPARAQDAAQASDPQSTIEPASQIRPLPLTGITQIAAGTGHTCALTTGGGVKCWGDNGDGQLGDGHAPNDSLTPVNVEGLTDGVAAIAAGSWHACALTTGGGVECWGDNTYGQLGDDDAFNDSPTPVDVVGLDSGVTAVAAGYNHTCALTTGGIVQCWGDNSYGQLGNPAAPNPSDTPVGVVNLASGVTAITAGGNHTCAVGSEGGAWCWGENTYGQLGNDSAPTIATTPDDVSGLSSGVTAIAAGFEHTCALTTGGGAWCWGNNNAGQLGNDDVPNISDTPDNVLGLNSGVAAITTGSSHTCALTASGGAKCWGYNFAGQVGDGNAPTNRTVPGDVAGLTGGVIAIDAGGGHTCAVIIGGGVKCWGSNTYGQLGDGSLIEHDLPVDVLTPTTCYKLTRNKSGSGSVPAADPANTPGCPANHYLPGQIVTLLADSAAGARVNGWAGTANNGVLSEVNYLRMPAADRTVSVAYATCRALTTAHTGAGGNPVASPDRSANCAENSYVSGETVTLIAKPNANQRVKSWTGADTNPFTGETVNSLTMPDANRTVNVAYEACFALSAVVAGQGDPITANPASSTGCAASAYVAGESIALNAAAATGWSIQGWSGTANNASTANTNALTMPAANHAVGVTYVEDEQPAATGALTGQVYEDANGNGQADAGEGVAGVTVTLASASAAELLTDVTDFTDITDGSGVYSFAGVPEGEYTLHFDMPEGYAPLDTVQVTISAGQTTEVPERKAVEEDEPGGPGDVYLPSLLR